MKTITGLYDSYEDARSVVGELENAGIPSSDISIVGREGETTETYAGEGVETGAGVGAVVAATGGLLAGLGLLAIPGVGPVVAAGWLAAMAAGIAAGAAAGGAAGGIIGSLTRAGISHDDAHVYTEDVRRGCALVSVRTYDAQADLARSIINRSMNHVLSIVKNRPRGNATDFAIRAISGLNSSRNETKERARWAGTFSLSLLTFGDTIAVANRSLMYRETFKLAAQGGASTRSLRH